MKDDDKNKMATAVVTPAGDDRGKMPSPAAGNAGSMQVFKPGEGYATRLGMMAVIAAYVGFACHHWYYNWVFVRDFMDDMFTAIGMGRLTHWMLELSVSNAIAIVGVVVIAAVGLATGYYYIYIKRPTAEFLIKTDTELNKVTWPRITPWFKADTPVWGASYVVLIVVVAMTVYVFGVDMVLQRLSQWAFYGTSR